MARLCLSLGMFDSSQECFTSQTDPEVTTPEKLNLSYTFLVISGHWRETSTMPWRGKKLKIKFSTLEPGTEGAYLTM